MVGKFKKGIDNSIPLIYNIDTKKGREVQTMITKRLIRYGIEYRYINTRGEIEFEYKDYQTMSEVKAFIDGLKAHYGESLKAVFLTTNEEIEI